MKNNENTQDNNTHTNNTQNKTKQPRQITKQCDKVSNNITHCEERLMKLVYKEFEVIRICGQYVSEADAKLNKDWVKNHVRSELRHFVEAQERR